MAENPESDAFIAGVDAKIVALQQLRESYLAAIAAGAIGQGGIEVSDLTHSAEGTIAAGQPPPSGPVELPTGVFRYKGISDSIRTYLSIARRKQTTKEITTALQEGGLASTATDFERNLRVTLYRLRDTGELLSFKDGWDLASSYPESFRQRMAQNSDAAPKRKRKRKAKKKPGRPQTKTVKAKATTDAEHISVAV